MMVSSKNSFGAGRTVPPEKQHIEIYFIEKGESEAQVNEFYQYWQSRGWKNKHNRLVSDWKVAAWTWIWDRRFKESFKS